MSTVKVGIIGGSGLNDPKFVENGTERAVVTQFGKPSAKLIEGIVANVPCVMIARHGNMHSILPHEVNYRANIWALKQAGCTHVLASTACGGLQEYTQPGDFVILDQFFDRTSGRSQTFYGQADCCLQGVLHMPAAEPFCEDTRQMLIRAARNLGMNVVNSTIGPRTQMLHPCVHTNGSAVTINGPRFSTRCESKLFQSWGIDIVNMTSVPEVMLAREAGLSYAAMAIVTDYDCWKLDKPQVTVEAVLEEFGKNVDRVKQVLVEAVKLIGQRDWSERITANRELVQRSRHDLVHSSRQN